MNKLPVSLSNDCSLPKPALKTATIPPSSHRTQKNKEIPILIILLSIILRLRNKSINKVSKAFHEVNVTSPPLYTSASSRSPCFLWSNNEGLDATISKGHTFPQLIKPWY